MKIKNSLILALVFVLMSAGSVFAHKVIIFAWVEDGMIHTESSFGAKRKAKNCAITVVDEKGRKVHAGRTDTNGNHVFKIPEKMDSDLILTLEAGTGHTAQWRVPKEELLTVPSASDIQSAMVKKETLEQGPSLLKIVSGIVLIFLAAFGVKWFKRKRATHD